jgi:hypothetical protein
MRLLPLLLLLVMLPCQAKEIATDPQCVALGKRLAKQLYPHALPGKYENSWPHHERYDPELDLDDLNRLVQCKAMPDDDAKLIMLLPVAPLWETTNPQNDEEESACCDVDILVLAKSNAQIIARMHEHVPVDLAGSAGAGDGWVAAGDGWRIVGYTIDTARYKVTRNARAFGIRVDYEPATAHRTFDHLQSLSLYIAEAGSIRQILNLLEVAHNDGMPSFEEDVCEPTTRYMQRTLSMASTAAHGYFDLTVHESFVGTRTAGDTTKEPCDTKTSETKRLFTLHFDGTQYRVPSQFRVFATPNSGTPY